MPNQKPSGGSSKVTAGPSGTSSRASNNADRAGNKMHKRSRSGCFTCRLRRKKCDEGHPACKACTNLYLRCEYKRPIWWGSPDQRKLQKERIKNKIKQTKSLERNNALPGQIRARALASSDSDDDDDDLNRDYARPITSNFENFGPHYANPGWVPISYGSCGPYEVDVRTERQTFVNDVPLRQDSSVSTFSAMGPPQLHATLPTFPAEEWLQEEYFNPSQSHVDPSQSHAPADPAMADQSIGQSSSSLTASIPVSDYDRPLLDHFVENVLRMIFPILEVHQRGSARARAVLQSLETNKSYFHCCLSVAAIHLKTTGGLSAEQIDHDIMRHRYEAISELCKALNTDSNHEHILDATLAMIFFHCSVGSPADYLPDIPWNDHFQAVSNLVSKLDLTNSMVPCGNGFLVPPFSMSLTSWIDILGATMLGKTPQFAHSYRTKHLSGTPSGLKELMGCDDRVMYLISEIACLESLKNENRIDELTICNHVSALGNQLEYTESGNSILETPYTPTGAMRPEVLTNNMTAVFRLAARIYLCSLIPGTDKNQSSIRNLVTGIADAMAFIPAGMYGFDRSLVWPLLIAGAFSTPTSSFRQVLTGRVVSMGEYSDLGSFGRMYQLLTEFWRLSDDPVQPPVSSQNALLESSYSTSNTSPEIFVSPPLTSPGMREIKRQQVHWRDVMDRNGWRYLLI